MYCQGMCQLTVQCHRHRAQQNSATRHNIILLILSTSPPPPPPQRHDDHKEQHNTRQHSTAQHSTWQHSTAQHNTTQYSTTQYSTTQYHLLGKEWDVDRSASHITVRRTAQLPHSSRQIKRVLHNNIAAQYFASLVWSRTCDGHLQQY